MERFKCGVAVVTGSSSGIGEAVSEALVQLGQTVVGLARRQDKLQALSDRLSRDRRKYPGQFHWYKCDISIEKEIRDTFARIKTDLGPISILVNNAGVLSKDDSELLNVAGHTFDVIFATNVKGALICTQEAVSSMLENGIDGHVITVNSLNGLQEHEMSVFNLYSSAKHALRVQFEAIRRELSQHTEKIKITTIFPGGTKTELTKDLEEGEDTYEPSLRLLPEDVVKYIISILDTAPTVLVSELTIVPILHHY